MDVLFNTECIVANSRLAVWQLLTSPALRQHWQCGVSNAKLHEGSPGYRGALLDIHLETPATVVRERTLRAIPEERLQLETKIGDAWYRQTFCLSRVDAAQTRLLYRCQRQLDSGWRQLLKFNPEAPVCISPRNIESLSEFALQYHAETHTKVVPPSLTQTLFDRIRKRDKRRHLPSLEL